MTWLQILVPVAVLAVITTIVLLAIFGAEDWDD